MPPLSLSLFISRRVPLLFSLSFSLLFSVFQLKRKKNGFWFFFWGGGGVDEYVSLFLMMTIDESLLRRDEVAHANEAYANEAYANEAPARRAEVSLWRRNFRPRRHAFAAFLALDRLLFFCLFFFVVIFPFFPPKVLTVNQKKNRV